MPRRTVAAITLLLLTACDQGPAWVRLGRPTRDTPLRQIFSFEDRLYLGHGDATANLGATDVLSWRPGTGSFATEFTCDDEVIQRYRILDGLLVIPGADATEDWSWGNVYVREPSGWVKHRTLPKAVHVLDVACLAGRWFAAAAIKTESPFSVGAVFESADRGRTWKMSTALPAGRDHHTRIGTLVVHKDRLLAFPYCFAGDRYLPDPLGETDALVFDGSAWKAENLVRDPDLAMIRTVVVFNGDLLIHAVHGKNVLFGYRGEPLNVLTDGRKRHLVANVRDVEVCGDRLVVLDDRTIRTTRDLVQWETVILPTDSPAESVWLESGRFYVGCRDGSLQVRR